MSGQEETVETVLYRFREALASRYTDAEIESFIERKRLELEVLVSQGQRPRHWFELYNHRGGVPRDSLPGYRRARELAAAIFARSLALLDEPAGELDLGPALAMLGSLEYEGEYDEAEALADAHDLPFLVGTVDWSPEEVGDLLVAAMDTEARGGIVPDDTVKAQIADRIWEAEKHLELRSLDKHQACDFISRHHSLLPYCNPRGMMYAIGAYWQREDGRRPDLVAVATAGTPTGRWGPGACAVDGILELTRIASISGVTRLDRRGRTVPVSASSALASRLIDLLPASGRRGTVGCRFVTYSVVGERATTYLALVGKGLRPVGIIRGKPAKGGKGEVAAMDKLVWEAGPAAREPVWDALPEDRRRGAMLAYDAWTRRDRSVARPGRPEGAA